MGIHTYSGYKPVMCEFPWFFPWVFPMKSTQKSNKHLLHLAWAVDPSNARQLRTIRPDLEGDGGPKKI